MDVYLYFYRLGKVLRKKTAYYTDILSLVLELFMLLFLDVGDLTVFYCLFFKFFISVGFDKLSSAFFIAAYYNVLPLGLY